MTIIGGPLKTTELERQVTQIRHQIEVECRRGSVSRERVAQLKSQLKELMATFYQPKSGRHI